VKIFIVKARKLSTGARGGGPAGWRLFQAGVVLAPNGVSSNEESEGADLSSLMWEGEKRFRLKREIIKAPRKGGGPLGRGGGREVSFF